MTPPDAFNAREQLGADAQAGQGISTAHGQDHQPTTSRTRENWLHGAPYLVQKANGDNTRNKSSAGGREPKSDLQTPCHNDITD